VLVAVNHNKYPLRFNVGFLINQSLGASRDINFDFENIHLNPDLELMDFHGTARLSKTQQGILVQGTFDTKVAAECVRCLTEFQEPLHTEFSELYAFKSRSVSESELILPEDANINLEPIVREYLLVEIPISPLCKEDCRGLCVVCGEDLNVCTCEHQQQAQVD
jgi:uncharacterized protein